MPPARRSHLSSHPPPSCSAADPRDGIGWLSTLLRVRAKRPRRADDDGMLLSDELLLVIFAGAHDLADLVRCAATCRRWRRLVSAEAAFLCRTPRRPPGRFVGPLALGFFHHREDGAAPRFVPTATASRRFPGLLRQPPPSLSTLVDDGLFDGSSHIVASRNGLLVVDLRRGKHDRALKLCVCNPVSGEVHILPPLEYDVRRNAPPTALGRKGVPEHYVCTVLTEADIDAKTICPPKSSYFRLVMLYTRWSYPALRSYSSEDGSWSEEAKVTSARLGRVQMCWTHSGIVGHGGRIVYWLAKNIVFVLSLEKQQYVVASMPRSVNGYKFDMENTLLGLSPEGRLCAVQFGHLSLATANRRVSIRVTTCTDLWWDMEEVIQVEQSLPADVTNVRMRWFCGKSGLVFFSIIAGDSEHRRSEMYALSLNTGVVENLVSHDMDSDPWGHVHGYEMDEAAYLASLAEPEGMEDM